MLKKITWLIIIRLLVVSLFLSVGAFVFKIDKSLFYFLIAFLYFLTLIYLFWLLSHKYLKTLLFTQIIIDVILSTAIITATGSLDSVFIVLYIVNILIAAVIVNPLSGMITTAIVSILYSVQVYLIYFSGYLNIPYVNKDSSILFYTVQVHIITFLLVGILSYLLSKKVNQMEERVKDKERSAVMGEMAAQIAHEIRNPLTAISGSIELLQEDIIDKISNENKQLMQSIIKESERMSAIFDEFLDFSKINKMNFVKLALSEIIDETILSLENQFDITGIEIIKDYDNKINLTCDRERLKQVFYNLFKNSIDAMNNEGVLSIAVKDDFYNVYIEIKDNGIGIRKEMLKDIFKPFKTAKTNGVGLGLVIANKIIGKHGGNISLENLKPHGALTKIILPKEQIGEL